MNPIAFEIGPIAVRWYSVFIFLALLIAGSLALNETKKWKITEDFIINLLFFLIPIAIIGARLYYVIFNWSYYSTNLIEILEIWNGGLAIHGGIIAGIIWIIIYTKKNKVDTLRVLDIFATYTLLGQAIGRFGNFFNQEAHGPACSLAFLQKLHLPDFIINGMYINGTYYQPTFLYESLWCLLGFIVILLFRHFKKYLKLGQLTSFYLVWYGIGRFFIEALRTDSLMIGSLKQAQIISIVMVLVGITMYIYESRGSKFERLYNWKDNPLNEETI